MILLIRFVDKLETNFLLKDRQVKRRGIKPRLIFNAYPYLKIPMDRADKRTVFVVCSR